MLLARRIKLYLGVAAVLIVVAVASFLVSTSPAGLTRMTTSSASTSYTPVCSNLPDMAVAANEVFTRDAESPHYVEQLWMGFAQNFTSLAYNVTAVAQSDSYGYGPSYLLNGLTDKGLWYQVGVSYNRVSTNGLGYSPGFQVTYEVWNSSTNRSVFPASGTAGSLYFNDTKSEDNVQLSVNLVGGSVIMKAYDWRLRFTASVSYDAEGADYFVGSADRVSRYPSSILTEWQHVLPYFCSNQKVTFSCGNVLISEFWLGIDEWNLTNVQPSLRFGVAGSTVFDTVHIFSLGNPADLLSLGGAGTTIYANATQFLTM
jgi:hypothetical protein